MILGNRMIIAVDFDGTLSKEKYVFPEIGTPNTELIEILKIRQLEGDKIILWTCRTGEQLNDAVEWCKKQNLHFDAINENIPEVIEKWNTTARKICADVYIDDKNVNEKDFINHYIR